MSVSTLVLTFGTDSDRTDAAIALAGLLAERGVPEVQLTGPGGESQSHAARHTDLPALIITTPAGSCLSWAGGEARIERNGLYIRLDQP